MGNGLAAVAVVGLQANGQPLPGIVGKLVTGSGMQDFIIGTNKDGYDEFKEVPLPFTGSLRIMGTAKFVEYPLEIPADAVDVTLRLGGQAQGPFDQVFPAVLPFKRPFTPAPHGWTGNFCGTHVAGLPPIQGCADDPTLVLSWFYPFYPPEWRAAIRESWLARPIPYLDVVMSWPDCRARGFTPQMFADSCNELLGYGFRPCPFLTSKDFDLNSGMVNGADVQQIIADLQPVLAVLVGLVPRACVGWELNLWLSPQDVQDLTDALMPPFVAAGAKTYTHFYGYMGFPIEGDNAVYWIANIGKLFGVLNERDPNRCPTIPSYVDFIEDCLERFAGNDNMPASNGIDLLPFDFIALEITAMNQFNGEMSEDEGDMWGRAAINAPPKSGPAGLVGVMGSGNGQ